MELTNLIPLVETCERLKELGWASPTFIRWYTLAGKAFPEYYKEHQNRQQGKGVFLCSAPTAQEIGQYLPAQSGGLTLHIRKFGLKNPMWNASYHAVDDIELDFDQANMAESMALALIWIIEHNYYKFTEET